MVAKPWLASHMWLASTVLAALVPLLEAPPAYPGAHSLMGKSERFDTEPLPPAPHTSPRFLALELQ